MKSIKIFNFNNKKKIFKKRKENDNASSKSN